MTKWSWNFLLFFLGIVCFLSSCATPTVQHGSEGGEISDASQNGPQALDPPAIFDQDPRLIAILPFENLTQNDDEEEKFNETEIARKTFANHFSSRGYKIQWIHTTDKLLKKEGYETVDEVVFAQEGDLQLLGARTLEGFNAVVDFRRKKLVAAGPMPAA